MSIRSCLGTAFEALARNKLQSALTMIGITIGVATVLTMVAVGSGAQAAIDQQIRAAGMNLIVVRAGNYKVKTEDDFGGVVDHQAAVEGTEETERTDAVASVLSVTVPSVVSVAFHPEDDPMEKHDHPTASQRLGDTAAGLGAAATLTAADAAAVRRIRGVQYVSEGVHENVRVATDAKRWFTRVHGADVELPEIRRAWAFPAGRFFTSREQARAS